MNRIEIAARHHAEDGPALEAHLSTTPLISCTPALAAAIALGTLAGAAICAYIVSSFESEIPDSAGEATESGLVVGDLVSRRRAATAGFV